MTSNYKRIEFMERMLATINPANTLKKGYTITKVDGKAAKSASEIMQGNLITTIFWDGEVKSIVK